MDVVEGSRPTLTRLGIASWSVIGILFLASIVVSVLAAVSALVLPLVLAGIVGAVTYPLARYLHRWMRPSLAAMAVVLAAIGVVVGVVLITISAIVNQVGELSRNISLALADLGSATDGIGLGSGQLESIRESLHSVVWFIGAGLASALVGSIGTLVTFVASGILATLIMYYVLKDGPELRTWIIGQLPDQMRDEASSFLSGAVRTVRAYWTGRSVLSAIITSVIVVMSLVLGLPMVGAIAVTNFVGGYIPYIGAFIGGGLAVMMALAEGGVGQALLVLAIVLTCNLVLESILEPKVMSGKLSVHPLAVLLATTTGGVVGGIVGLVIAVPVMVVTTDLVRRLRSHGVVHAARAKATTMVAAAQDGSL